MKKKGRYQHTNPNKASKRKYMSYEDVPLREYRDTEPVPQNLTQKFIKVFFFLFIAVVAVMAMINVDNLTPDNISHWFQYDLLGKTEGSGYPVRFNGISVNSNNFSVMDRTPVYCSDTSVVVLNSNAGEYQNTQHAFANPIMKTNMNYSIIFNADATNYKIINRESTVYSGTTDKKLFDADVAENGTYALLTYGSDYLSALNVYKSDNNKRYSYSFADYYVNNLSLNNTGSGAALSGVSAKNGGLISVIYILDFNQENYLQKYEIEDSYIYEIKYLDNGNVIAVGDSCAYHIDVENGKKTDINYGSKTLTTYTLNAKFGLLLSLSVNPDGRECDIIAINNTGKTETEINTKNKVESLDYKNEKIAALLPSSVVIYDTSGKQLAISETSTDARKACFADNNTLYVLGTSNISKISVDYSKN